MRQALHIFCKDIRSLSIQICAVLLLFIGHAVFEARSWPVYNRETSFDNSLANLLGVLLPLGIFFLVALLVFEEALPGDKKDWLTRPYSRCNLLAAKVLFIVAFFNVLLFLSDCYILGVQGFAVASALPHLLLRQVTFTVAYILPSFAIASLTATISRFFLAWFLILLGLITELIIVASLQSSHAIMASLSIGTGFMITFAVLSVAVIIWQYGWRQTGKARLVAACLIFAYFPASYGFSTLTRKPFSEVGVTPFNAQGLHVTYQSGPLPAIPHERNSPAHYTTVWFPLIVQGAAPGTLLRGQGWAVIQGGGVQWTRPMARWVSSVDRIESQYWQRMILSDADFERVKQQPVNVQTSWNFELASDTVAQIIHPGTRPFFMKNAGLCRVFKEPLEQPGLACKAGLNLDTEATVRVQPNLGTFEARTWPSEWALSPVTTTLSTGALNGDIDTVAVIPRRKLAACLKR